MKAVEINTTGNPLLSPIKSLLDIGISHQTTSLTQLRQRFVNVVNLLYLALMFIIIAVRAANDQLMVALLNSVFFTLILVSLYVSHKGKLVISIALSGWVVMTQPFLLAYLDLLPAFQLMPQLVLFTAVFQIASPTKIMRCAFVIYSLILLLLVSLTQGYTFSSSLPFLIQVLVISIVVCIYVNFRESQDSTLNRAIDDLKKTNDREHALNESLTEKNADLKMYSDIMSHDLRSPLQTIMMSSELIERNSGSVETVTECSDLIKKSADSINQLLDDVLLYSKVDSSGTPKFEQIQLRPLVDQIIETQLTDIDKRQVNFTIGKLPTIMGDRSLLRALFQNLISNALKFQPLDKPGHIAELQITSEFSYSGASEELEDSGQSGTHIISIRDNGIGIAMSDAEDLFVTFKRLHSAHYDGTGLGLSICKRVMQTHNGKIRLESSSEQGSCFQLIFHSYNDAADA